jgi:Flp pilus assembly protein TadD
MQRGYRLVPFALPFLAGLVLFAATLRFDLTFDDHHHMSPPGVAETRTWSQVWSRPTLFYRPVVVSTFWAEGKLDLPLWVRHGLNVLLHGAVTLLVVRLVLSLGFGSWWACAAGLLFAVHPAHVEAVAGLVGRADVMAALWVLLALWLHDRVIADRAPGGLVLRATRSSLAFLGALSLAFLAAGSKESAWLLPLFGAALHAVRRKSLNRAWPLWAGYALGIYALLLLRHQALGGWLRPPGRVILPWDNPLASLHGMDRFLGGLRVVGLNAYHLVFPAELAPDYSGGHFTLSGGLDDLRLWAGVVLVAGSLLGIAWSWRHAERPGGKAVFLAGVILITSAFIVMNLAFNLETVLGDRLLYWPSVAWVLVLVSAAAFLGKAGTSPRPRIRSVAVIGVLVILGAGYAVRSAAYLPSWKNDYTLFSRAAKVVPEVPRVWYNLGLSQRKAGDVDNALASFRKARTLSDDFTEAWTEEGALLMASGHWDEARAPLAQALRLAPADPLAVTNHGVLLLHDGKAEDAARAFRKVLETDPTQRDALYDLGLAEETLQRYDAAVQAWTRYLESNPVDAGALARTARLLAAELGRPRDGEVLARQAVAIDPESAYTFDALAETLFRQGRKAEALDAARKALGLEDTPYYRDRLRSLDEGKTP